MSSFAIIESLSSTKRHKSKTQRSFALCARQQWSEWSQNAKNAAQTSAFAALLLVKSLISVASLVNVKFCRIPVIGADGNFNSFFRVWEEPSTNFP